MTTLSNSTATPTRRARVERKTRESDIIVELDLDGTGDVSVQTGVPFFDHMLTSLGTHASFDLAISAQGDVDIEGHQQDAGVARALAQLRDKAPFVKIFGSYPAAVL